MRTALINLYNMMINARPVLCIYVMWICLHYIAVHLYASACAPSTLVGFLTSPFMTLSPHCQALRWVIYQGGNSINAMWFILSGWLLQYFAPVVHG
jgi:hypothetical protein